MLLRVAILEALEIVVDKKLGRRKAKFMIRGMTGLECGLLKGKRFRLSEWDQAIEAGLDFGHAWHVFVTWLRRRCPDFEFIVIVHRPRGAIRHDYHVICYGSDKLPLLEIEAKWQGLYLSPTGGLAEIKSPKRAMKYVAGYVSDSEKFVR